MKTLTLVYAPQEENTKLLYSSEWCVPLGNLSIGTYAKLNGFDVRILDSAVLTYDEIKKSLEDVDQNAIVGLSTTMLNFRPSVELAKEARSKGATVVFGGSQSSGLAHNLLSQIDEVDYVVRGEGELPIVQILKDINPECIPNLVYRSKNETKENPATLRRDWIKFSPDRSLVAKLENYKSNWHRQNPSRQMR